MLLKLIVLCVFITQVVKAQARDKVTFHIYTQNQLYDYGTLVTGQLEGMSIDVSKPFKIITDSYEYDHSNIKMMKDEYLRKGDYNVVMVNWNFREHLLYDEAADYTRIAGKHLADLIIDLNKIFALSFKNVHLIGNGLGAHISGFAAKNIINSGYEKIARITGMDAASPLFYLRPPNDRLAIGDANFIDCIHTDNLKFGNGTTLGDADFYPDGASSGRCQSHQYFTASIYSNEFKAKQCNSYSNFITGQCYSNSSVMMGENVDLSARGSYYRFSSRCYS